MKKYYISFTDTRTNKDENKIHKVIFESDNLGECQDIMMNLYSLPYAKYVSLCENKPVYNIKKYTFQFITKENRAGYETLFNAYHFKSKVGQNEK